MRLPLPWFERRYIGDLISRFTATQPIKDFISEGMVAVLVDGVMALVTLVLIVVYSPLLALVVLAECRGRQARDHPHHHRAPPADGGGSGPHSRAEPRTAHGGREAERRPDVGVTATADAVPGFA
jgi:hypothetical protein